MNENQQEPLENIHTQQLFYTVNKIFYLLLFCDPLCFGYRKKLEMETIFVIDQTKVNQSFLLYVKR